MWRMLTTQKDKTNGYSVCMVNCDLGGDEVVASLNDVKKRVRAWLW